MNIFGRKKRALQAEIESLKVERDGLDADRTRLRKSAEEAAAQREEVRAQNTHLTRDMEELRSQMEDVQANIGHLKEQSARQEKTVADQKKVNAQQKQEIAKNESRIGKLEADLADARTTAVKQTEALAKADQARVALETTHATLVDDSEKLRRSLNALNLHEGPTTFAPDTHVYKKDEPRPAESVLITTMPKAGTYYLSRLFSDGIGLRPLIVSNQYFPEDTIYQPRLREFFKGGYVSQDHFPATPINVAHLCHLTEKIIVHVRDPRQATLSYIHFLDDEMFQNNLEEAKKLIFPTLPEDFFDRDLAGRLNWGIDYWMPELISWVQQWQIADQESTLTVKFTQFEDLVEDSAAFARGIVEFLGIPSERFVPPIVELDSEVHFRKGETEEWREVFSEQQTARANGFLPPDLSEQFSWQP